MKEYSYKPMFHDYNGTRKTLIKLPDRRGINFKKYLSRIGEWNYGKQQLNLN